MVRLRFLGAAGTVTGSKFLLSTDGSQLLIDCGLYQGLKELRLRNWAPLPVEAGGMEHVVVTHAHIDHAGFLPKFVKLGFQGRIITTPLTIELLKIMLPDSAHLQEEEAYYSNKKKVSRHDPALPLYTMEDAHAALGMLQPCSYGKRMDLPGFGITMKDAGHILGSSIVEVWVGNGKTERKIVFSGDLGRYGAPILEDPTPIERADYLVLESTYGDRLHSPALVKDKMASAVLECVKNGGCLLIPAFTVERTQEILYILKILRDSQKIPAVPIYLDSPMAIEVTGIFRRHPEVFDEEARKEFGISGDIFAHPNLHMASSVEESKAINDVAPPLIIISANGMATGGRVLHHLKHRLPDPKNVVLLVGFQAAGTRGRALQEGARSIRIFGEKIPVRAKVSTIDGFSSHADFSEILRWLGNFKSAPEMVFLVHGEPQASSSLAEKIRSIFGWQACIPQYLERYDLN